MKSIFFIIIMFCFYYIIDNSIYCVQASNRDINENTHMQPVDRTRIKLLKEQFQKFSKRLKERRLLKETLFKEPPRKRASYDRFGSY